MFTGNPVPLSEGSFGKTYENMIPNDGTVSEYDPERFSVITGLTGDRDGLPLPGVSVTVHGHPEYGIAVTDAEGRFSIPVEGGAVMNTCLPERRAAHFPQAG